MVGRKARASQQDVVTDDHFLVNLGPLADLSAAAHAADVAAGRHRLAR